MNKILSMLLACIAFATFNVSAEIGVERSAFTTAIEDKEPVSELKKINTDINRIYFFTELQGLNGRTITHRWEYNGQVMAELSFKVGGDRWRTWSSKNMLSSWVGRWQVSVLDEGGNIIEQSSFEYISPAERAKPEEAETAE